jgi:hypothetical protein
MRGRRRQRRCVANEPMCVDWQRTPRLDPKWVSMIGTLTWNPTLSGGNGEPRMAGELLAAVTLDWRAAGGESGSTDSSCPPSPRLRRNSARLGGLRGLRLSLK